MTIEALTDQYSYGYWANKKLFDVIAQLTPEEFTRNAAGTYGSIRSTLVHMLSAESGWLERCGGPMRGGRLNPNDFPTFQSVLEGWQKQEANLIRLLGQLSDEDLHREVAFSLDQSDEYLLTLGELLHHAAIHGVHHRGQIALLLRLLGHAPGNFDVLIYYRNRRNDHAN
jgi:uncharacterized damage-inducible protein DinB